MQSLSAADPRLSRGAAIDFTPTKNTSEADVYKYYCPICMMYFKNMIHSACCENYICKYCVLDFIDQQDSHDVPCPFCTKFPLRVLTVHKWENVRSYQDEVQHPNVPAESFMSPVRIGEGFEALKRKLQLREEDGFINPQKSASLSPAAAAAQASTKMQNAPSIELSSPNGSISFLSPQRHALQSPAAGDAAQAALGSLSLNLSDTFTSPSPVRRHHYSSGSDSSAASGTSPISEMESHSSISPSNQDESPRRRPSRYSPASDDSGRHSSSPLIQVSSSSSSPMESIISHSSASHNSWLSASEEAEIPLRLRRRRISVEASASENDILNLEQGDDDDDEGEVEISESKGRAALRKLWKGFQSLFCCSDLLVS